MPSHDAFLKEITANPEDLTPRLVYADWLDEQGDPRGEFIRVQCELARLDETDERYPERLVRERELLAEHRSEWLKPLRRYIRSGTFRCGFVERAKMRFQAFLREGENVAKLTPLRTVALTASGASTSLHELPDAPLLQDLSGLEFHSFGIAPQMLETLIRLPELPKLKHLKISNTPIARQYVLRSLLKAPICANLSSLSLRRMNLTPDFFADLAQRDLALHQLDLSSSTIFSAFSGGDSLDGGFRDLSSWPGFSRILSLDVSGCRIQRAELERFLQSADWGPVCHLNVGNYEDFDVGILAKPAFADLVALGAMTWGATTSQLGLLLNSPFLTKLRRLAINLANDSASSIELFGMWPGLRNLTHLQLFHVGEVDWEILFRSPYWNPATRLSVDRFQASRIKGYLQKHPEFRDVSFTTRPVPMGYLHTPLSES